jgi:cytochrome c5
MTKKVLLMLSTFTVMLLLSGLDRVDAAIQAPHDYSSSMTVTCMTCHEDPLLPFQPQVGDNTAQNNSCLGCHHEGNDAITDRKYKTVKTHSSTETSGRYGSWMIECRVCHEAHNQMQAVAYPTEGILATGILSAATPTLLTTSNILTAGAYPKFVVIPNAAYPGLVYRIADNSENTILTTGFMYLRGSSGSYLVAPGQTYTVKYGKMIKPTIAYRTVKFFNAEGPNSFADGDAVVDGICQVCHTQTQSFRNDGTLEGPGHPTGVAATNCMQCHPHSSGFKAGAL